MAEFAIADDGHAWNNSLAHATFEDNVATHGKETALKYLRQDIRSWISERKNESHQWSLYVRDGHMITETGVSLDEMTSNITNGPHSDLVPETIKATALLEAATLEEATRLAATGANRIVLPEQHEDASGAIVSRYLSVWTKSSSDPSRYDGTRIDLGKNIPVEDVRTGSSFTAFQHEGDVAFHQHGVEKQAFVLEVKDDGGKSFEIVEKAIITSVHRSHQETYARDARVMDTFLTDSSQRWVRSESQYVQNEVGNQREPLNTPNIQSDHHTDIFIYPSYAGLPRKAGSKRLRWVDTQTIPIVLGIDVPRADLRDTAETVKGVSLFFREKKQQREANTLILEKHSERLTLEKIREKPVRMVEVIEKRYEKMRKEMVAIKLISETGTAAHAATFLLASLAEKFPLPIRAVEKSMRRHEKKVRKVRKAFTPAPHVVEVTRDKKATADGREVQDARTNSEKVQFLKPKRIESLGKAEERKKIKRRNKVYMEMTADGRRYTLRERGRRVNRDEKIGVSLRRAAAEKLTPIKIKRSENLKRRRFRRFRQAVKSAELILETKQIPKKEKKLWMTRLSAAGEFNLTNPAKRDQSRQAGPIQPIRETMRKWNNTKIEDKRREMIAGVQFAWMVWMMLNRANFPPVASKSAMLVSERRGVKLIHPSGVEQESSPWVLLSIIWYLTAIREQGMGNYPMKKKRRKLPKKGIIFAFRS